MENNQINDSFKVTDRVLPKDNTLVPNYISPVIQNLSTGLKNQAKSDLMTGGSFGMGSNLNDVASLGTDSRIKMNTPDIGLDAYVSLSDGTLIPRFEKYRVGVDNEEQLARAQTTGDKWANAIPKFLGKTLVNVAGGTIGAVEGLYNGIKYQSLSAMYTSDFNVYLDDLNKKLDYKLPNYMTHAEKDMNFGQKWEQQISGQMISLEECLSLWGQ